MFLHSAFSPASFSPTSWRFDQAAQPEPVSQTYGGRGRHKRAEPDAVYREHWDYLDGIRALQEARDRAESGDIPADEVVRVQIADDLQGAREIAIPVAAAVPESVLQQAGAAVPDTGRILRVADLMEDPITLAMLAILLDELD